MMRKYIVGFMVGAALTFAVQAGAASLLGSTIDAVIQVEVDGENLGQAPVIDGTSYLPVRKLGEAAGYDVSFGEGKATLTSEETAPIVSQEPTSTPVDVGPYTLAYVNESIKGLEGDIWATKAFIDSYEERGLTSSVEVMKETLVKQEAELEVWKQRKAELEAQQ